MAVTESPNLPSPGQERPIGFGRLKRKEDARFIRGKGTYLDDIRLPGMLHGAVLRSPYAHAKINSIDTSAALALPGVAAVITAKDLETLGLAWMPTISYDTQAVLAGDKVRFQGQEVAFVIATDEYIARDAARGGRRPQGAGSGRPAHPRRQGRPDRQPGLRDVGGRR
jgi:carbon-monoxide dehydrogenase large subunit